MQDDGLKIVEFDKYCKACVNKDVKDVDDPCNECLTESARQYSHKPLRYMPKQK